MTRDMVPQNYSLGLAAFDAVPVILFGLASWLLWKMTGNAVLLTGGAFCFAAGMLKVLWKFIVVLQKKNVWPLFVQMLIGMSAGFAIILIGFLVTCLTKDMSSFWSRLLRPAPILFVIISVLGMAAMIRCRAKLIPENPKANWIEQACNTVAQGAFLLPCFLFIKKCYVEWVCVNA